MLSVTVICIGKLKEKYLAEAVTEYQKRLTTLCKLNIIQLPAVSLSDNPKESEIEAAIGTEGRKILEKIPSSAFVFSLCIEGRELSSQELSRKISSLKLQGNSSLVFIIGGSYGLSRAVKERSDFRLSMSPMTFPHQLARVMLLEQIYRAMQIEAGTRYHK
ncbi:MAG: 23S rRNA (pseudouridine(1915)-N(3))-methyltransferase RlmH [Acutalibacteraceae bacterium]